MAVLTATGINFGTTTLDSKYGIFPQTSAVVFWQAAAPTGWVTVTTHDNKALRVVSGAAAGSGGTNDFTTTMGSARPLSANVPVSVVGAAGQATTLDTNTIPAHAHPANAGGAVGASGGGVTHVAPTGNTGSIGNGGSHTHPVTVNDANGPINTTIDFAVQYIDTIYCTFS